MSEATGRLRSLIKRDFSESTLTTYSSDQISAFRTAYPSIPQEVLDSYAEIGHGSIGKSRYMIHSPSDPSEFYDAQTAHELGPLLIVGDDFSGNCDAYDS